MPSAPAEPGRRTLRWADAQVEPGAAFAIAVTITLFVAVGDYLSGPYVAFATFYLVPVAFAGWFAGRRAALVIAGVASAQGVFTTAADLGEVSPTVNVVNGLLRFALYGFVGVVLAVARQALQAVAELATTDALTGLANRRQFEELAGRELAWARRVGGPVAVVYIDVDELKARNEALGHSAGDALLGSFADVARSSLRTTDVLARLGGDEFAALLPGSDGPTAEATIERVRQALRVAADPPITFSAGVVAGPVVDGATVHDLLQAADAAMFAAKAAGKDRTVAAAIPGAPIP